MASGERHAERLRFAVLGPVRVWRGGKPVSAGAPRQRALLAALLLRRGRAATIGELVDGLWGADPPRTAVSTVRTYTSRLQRAIAPGDAGVLVREWGGYTLRSTPGSLDIDVAERLAVQAEEARGVGDLSRASRLLAMASELWQGDALADLPGPYAQLQRARLAEWRLALVEQRIRGDLALGRHARAASELATLTAAHPLRQRLHELFMLALHHGGRQADALAVYADIRRRLAEEMGVEPDPALTELHRHIRGADRRPGSAVPGLLVPGTPDAPTAQGVQTVPAHRSPQTPTAPIPYSPGHPAPPARTDPPGHQAPPGHPSHLTAQDAAIPATASSPARRPTAPTAPTEVTPPETAPGAPAPPTGAAPPGHRLTTPHQTRADQPEHRAPRSDITPSDHHARPHPDTPDVPPAQVTPATGALDPTGSSPATTPASDAPHPTGTAAAPEPDPTTPPTPPRRPDPPSRAAPAAGPATDTPPPTVSRPPGRSEAAPPPGAAASNAPSDGTAPPDAPHRTGRTTDRPPSDRRDADSPPPGHQIAKSAPADRPTIDSAPPDRAREDPSPGHHIGTPPSQPRALAPEPDAPHAPTGTPEPADPDGPPASASDVRTSPAADSPAAACPAQLPADAEHFSGRVETVFELVEHLVDAGMTVTAVAGIGGVGKTTLAVHAAHIVRDRFPDGQLYVDLHGTSSDPADPAVVLGSFLRALGVPDPAVPKGLAERAALYRSAMDGRSTLVVLDNARDAAQVRPLLPGAAGCAVLVTSRPRLVDLEYARLIDLDVLGPYDALDLFARVAGEERVNAEREAAVDVVAACGFLPLALRAAASRLASRRAWRVSDLAARLADERRRLDELRAGDLAVKPTFELSYERLEPRQARAFRLLGLVEGPDLALAAAAALLDLDLDEAEDVLESLVDTSLLESTAPGRYRYHDLVRLFARDCAERDDHPADERLLAMSRLTDFYLATATRVYLVQRPEDWLTDHLEPVGRPGLDFVDRDSALDWLSSEADALLACARQAAAGATLRRSADLLLAATDLCESGAHARAYEAAASAVGTAAHSAAEPKAEGRARVQLARALAVRGRYTVAYEQAAHAALLGLIADDPWLACHASHQRGLIATSLGRHAEAETYLGQAIQAFRADANRPGEASALCDLSRLHLAAGRTSDAVRLARRATEICRSLGPTTLLANGQYALGRALTRSGEIEEALDQLTDALTGFRASRQPVWEGMTLSRLAEAHLAAHRPQLAIPCTEQALTQLRFAGGELRYAAGLVTLGRAARALDQPRRARACWTRALLIYENSGSSEAEAVRGLLRSAPET